MLLAIDIDPSNFNKHKDILLNFVKHCGSYAKQVAFYTL